MRFVLSCIVLLLGGSPALAGAEAFHPGPVIPGFGKIANVVIEQPIPQNAAFKVRFDVSKGARPGALNRTLETAARFLNMNVANGVKESNIHLAIVLHGPAAMDVTRAAYYGPRHDGAKNANVALVAALAEHGVQMYVCGQTAAYLDIKNDDLLPGITMALSALTAHAILANEGYALNPF